ncbi:NAD(P)-binding protein [Lophium mytilinum]|uniref:NAD(P)-binding protein n=1 Tax=Lophium mytilinum TaxID=390894 RepID=A0A6A6QPK8_9PEZI|nr:NAD(P)-binding protein [Lophium mytilinum]
MAASVLSAFSLPKPSDCFTYVTDYPRPSLPNKDWVLVRVHAAGLNRAELRARNQEHVSKLEFGMFIDEFHENHPKIIGEEFVGEVTEAGTDSGYKVGDVVCGWAYGGGKPYDGAYAEYTICHKKRCWPLPDSARKISWEVLGAVPMGLWTAYGSIFHAGQTKPGDTVFIHGATSSVGIWGILVSKSAGCTVVASTRQESKVQKLKDAGADHVVLEKDLLADPGLVKKLVPGGANTILSIVGLHMLKPIAFPACAMYGTVVSMGILGKVWSIPEFNASFIPTTRKLTTYTTLDEDYEPAKKVLADTVEKILSGEYKSEWFLDSVYDLKDVGKAHERMEANEACGKIVLRC